MLPTGFEDVARYRRIILERYEFHARTTFSLDALGLRGNPQVEVVTDLDQLAQRMCAQIRFAITKGETTQETRRVEFEYNFNVFASWRDHLKFQIKERWTRLPVWFRKRIHIRYVPITKTRTESVPVSIIRVCPHAAYSWDNSRERLLHVEFLAPEAYGQERSGP